MNKIVFATIGILIGLSSCNMNTMNKHKYTNHLIHESSPYLLQHAHNPVEWYPWNDEALAKAKEEDKMLIVSIGYSSCHWCHVMEHESFEDTTVARIMNENFICIKVDREERPDIDDIYMTACQIATGRGGWPLNAFAMPDGRPVWAGTYFPKDQWMKVLQNFIDIKKTDPNKLEKSASALTNQIQQSDQIIKIEEENEFDPVVLDTIGRRFLANFDLKYGGKYGAPKFPMPNNWDFLLAYGVQNKNNAAIESVLLTLNRMAQGGIYDPLGGGFARYSTDAEWKVPHFEKMLYDNGQLISLYSNAYKLTKDPEYLSVLTKSLEWIEREMTDDSGGFYSSLDADSEGEEGKYYIWSYEELKSIIEDPNDFKLYEDYYNISEEGNWEEGKNILFRTISDSLFASRNGMELENLWERIEEINDLLFNKQITRIRPGLDGKILTSWNALMLKGLADAYKATSNEKYKSLALKNAAFLTETQMQTDGSLFRNYKDGKSSINAFLDDYALLADALISVYEITFDEKWLMKSATLTDYAIKHFSNNENGMFNYTSDLDPPLVARKLELSDNVIPSSNSIMARMLYRLGDLQYNKEYLERSKQMLNNMYSTILETGQPNYYSNWCHLLFEWINPAYEIAIVGPDAEKLRNEMMQHYIPNSVLLGGETEGTLELLQEKLQEGDTYIYVCQNKLCKFPVTDVSAAIDLID